MNRATIRFTLGITLCGTGLSQLAAQDLRGIDSVAVAVAEEGWPDYFRQIGVTPTAVQTRIELELRLAGIPMRECCSWPLLGFFVKTVPNRGGWVTYTQSLSLLIEVYRVDKVLDAVEESRDVAQVAMMVLPFLRKLQGSEILTDIWDTQAFSVSARSQVLPDFWGGVEQLVKEFLNAYLRDNPRG